jgi:Spy/CpxP family protein refolding chaperone
MIPRIVPLLAFVAVLGACSSNSNTMPEPGSPNMSRAGRGQGNGQGGARMEQMALQGVTLSGDQQRRIDDINASYRAQMEQSRSGGNTDRSAMRGMRDKQRADIRAVLSVDQQAQYDRNIADMRNRQQQNGGDDRRPNG